MAAAERGKEAFQRLDRKARVRRRARGQQRIGRRAGPHGHRERIGIGATVHADQAADAVQREAERQLDRRHERHAHQRQKRWHAVGQALEDGRRADRYRAQRHVERAAKAGPRRQAHDRAAARQAAAERRGQRDGNAGRLPGADGERGQRGAVRQPGLQYQRGRGQRQLQRSERQFAIEAMGAVPVQRAHQVLQARDIGQAFEQIPVQMGRKPVAGGGPRIDRRGPGAGGRGLLCEGVQLLRGGLQRIEIRGRSRRAERAPQAVPQFHRVSDDFAAGHASCPGGLRQSRTARSGRASRRSVRSGWGNAACCRAAPPMPHTMEGQGRLI
ncbi:hypothetical protein NDR89_00785 [Cupriavidus gilardii]|uniref:Uncharacterized protein n=1 Tax=Cupriavidus gilardii TaxID=82541 RepID=A0ABY4VKP7_9BURK|nr:hypothetical protein [Cupriavidus gilardii]USE77630.1 hypothetical protein NDR89_00785 [Cupriavidus gilardii]